MLFVKKIKDNQTLLTKQSNFNRFEIIGSQWWPRIAMFLGYLVFFAVNWLTVYLINRFIGHMNDDGSKLDSNSKFCIKLIYVGHIFITWWYMWRAFSSFYVKHQNWRHFFIWFVFYLSNSVAFLVTLFWSETFFIKSSFYPKTDWAPFRYYFIVFAYLLGSNIVNNLYFICFNNKVDKNQMNLYKIRMLESVLLLIYVLIFYIIINPVFDNGKSSSSWTNWNYLYKIVYDGTGYDSDVIKILRFWGIMLVMFWPFIGHSIYYLFYKYKNWLENHKKLPNPMLQILSTRLSLVVMTSNIFYYITQLEDVYKTNIGSFNWAYIVLAAVIIVIAYGGMIWNKFKNKFKLNSSAYYFFIVSLGWLVLAWLMIIFFLSNDPNNTYTKLNSVVWSIGSLCIFITIVLNYHYLMNKVQMFVFNLSTTLIGFTLIAINFLVNKVVVVDVANLTNIYLFMYLGMGVIIFLNFNFFLFGFIKAIKQLKIKKTWFKPDLIVAQKEKEQEKQEKEEKEDKEEKQKKQEKLTKVLTKVKNHSNTKKPRQKL